MDYYLTDKIYIRDNIMYFNDKIINRNKWHTILNEYGWEKICLPWIKKLNKLSTVNYKNSPYAVYDCPTDGNCFYHCIANSLNEKFRFDTKEYNHKDIRELIADSINEKDFQLLMSYYRIMEDANDFDEKWDPYQISNIQDFKTKIKQDGNSYWGDYLLLNFITKKLKLNILILNSDSNQKKYDIYNTLIEYNSNYPTIFLVYEDNCHFKLLGYFTNSNIISYFNHENIPNELIKLFKLKY